MKPPPPPGPPDVADLLELVDQWVEFTTDLAKGYSFDLDNWLNDVDVRELILEALPMFSREEMGEHALKLDEADKAFMAATRDFKKCVWGKGTARKEKWTPQKNWWYFRTPQSSNPQLEDELATIR
jgi:hypothetical protein